MLPASWAARRLWLWHAAPPALTAAAAAAGAHARSAAATSPQQPARGLASLVFAAHGEPEEVLELRTGGRGGAGAPLGPGDVRLELVAAPINPSDINTVQGKYPLKPELPGVPGHEGVMRVVETGAEVRGLRPGDRVVPLASALGTWRAGGVFRAADWHAVPAELPDAAAATMCINPPTALSMLERFASLRPGDVVAQNGATSAVGQHVIQICRAKGIRTVNLIRDRPDWEPTVEWLRGMGADVVAREADVKAEL
ncbi:hypothetical protein Rsub_10584, partial [Raphidocelis subcapitata]